jgi:hypothetical protein
MTELETKKATFVMRAKPQFGTVSGLGTQDKPYRIAVRNVTGFKAVRNFALQFNAEVGENTGRFPQLVSIWFGGVVAGRICEACGNVKPVGQSCGCFDNDSQ